VRVARIQGCFGRYRYFARRWHIKYLKDTVEEVRFEVSNGDGIDLFFVTHTHTHELGAVY